VTAFAGTRALQQVLDGPDSRFLPSALSSPAAEVP